MKTNDRAENWHAFSGVLTFRTERQKILPPRLVNPGLENLLSSPRLQAWGG